jgi:predicted GTPase
MCTIDTQNIETQSFIYDGTPKRRIVLVDTPGFDDDKRTDAEILRILVKWLATASTRNLQLNGIIYLHPINQPRLQGSAKKNIRQFEKLCGENALQKVVLATTMWDVEDEVVATQRERQLLETKEFWGYMREKVPLIEFL